MAHSLEEFCCRMLKRYGSPWALVYNPSLLASEFVRYFGISSAPDILELHLQLQRDRLVKLQTIHVPELLSFNYKEGDTWIIEYNDAGNIGRNLHSILHEIFEIIQQVFEEIVQGYRAPWIGSCIKPFADRFAAAILMQPHVFLPELLRSGLDLVAIRHRLYSPQQAPSYPSVVRLSGNQDARACAATAYCR